MSAFKPPLMTTTTTAAANSTDRRRGLVLALALQSAIVALCVYPFLAGSLADKLAYETVVELDFRQSAAAASADARVRNATPRPVPEYEAAPKNPAPPALPTKPSPPVIAAPTPLPPVPDVPAPAEPEPDPVPTIEPEPTPPVEVPSTPAPESAPPASTVHGSGAANADGEVTGAPELGEGPTVGDAGEGASPVGSALGGKGVITRAVVFRPSLDDVIVENGVVVLDVCINQRGRVTQVQWNEEESSITDFDLVRRAQAKAKEYRFETDHAAPRLECGQLSIRIRGL